MAYAMKIHLKKNAAANGLVLMERLQGLTATDVTHSCDQRRPRADGRRKIRAFRYKGSHGYSG